MIPAKPAATSKTLVATTLVTGATASEREAALAQQVRAALAQTFPDPAPASNPQISSDIDPDSRPDSHPDIGPAFNLPLTSGQTANISAHAHSGTASSQLPRFAVLLEGLASGQSWLEQLQQQYPQAFTLQRIAPGCLCCSGNLVMRVSLNRLLRQQPQHLWIGIANTDHLTQIQALLQNPPYDDWLQLRPGCCDSA